MPTFIDPSIQNVKLKILFIYRGYGKELSNSVIDFQRQSLIDQGINIHSYAIGEGGILGYLKAFIHILSISSNYDLIHAHYSFSGFISALSTRKPIVCSLMGSDVLQQNLLKKRLILFFSKNVWRSVIVKSIEMQSYIPGSVVIPNGVDLQNFRQIEKEEALKQTGFDPHVRNIVFVAQKTNSYVKNFPLALQAVTLLNDERVALQPISGAGFKQLPMYYSAADVLVLTSFSEGSPNVIKEAMACNCPIVATDVGDIRDVIGDTEGCYLTSFEPEDVADKVRLALNFRSRTNGRVNISHLDSKIIADKLVELYKQTAILRHASLG